MQNLLLQKLASDFRRLTSKIEILSNCVSRHRASASKSVVIEGVARLVQLLPKPIIGILEFQYLSIVTPFTSAEPTEWIVLFEDASRARLTRLVPR